MIDTRLCPGDKVTLLLPDHVVMVEVEIVTRTYFEITLSSRGAKTYQSKWRMSEEGISWLRGYYLADSPEINACRTAQGLGAKQEKIEEMPTKIKSPYAGLLDAPMAHGFFMEDTDDDT